MKNEAIAVGIPSRVYLDLILQLRQYGDMRQPDEIVAVAINTWLAAQRSGPGGHGYQWRSLFLPDGTKLRMRYRGLYYYAQIEGDALVYAGEVVSPRDWTLMVTGTVRNAWRDIWIRRGAHELWTRACVWRAENASQPRTPYVERRLHRRRSAG